MLKITLIKYEWDRFWLSTPVIGKLMKRIEIARWSKNFGLMLSSGIPLLQALEISQNLTSNELFKDVIQSAPALIQMGAKLANALEKNALFPKDVIQMIATGESSGTLDKMLKKVSGFYAQLVTRSLRKLTAVIEPTFILFMGVVVGFIMLSIFLPIFDMIKIFKPS